MSAIPELTQRLEQLEARNRDLEGQIKEAGKPVYRVEAPPQAGPWNQQIQKFSRNAVDRTSALGIKGFGHFANLVFKAGPNGMNPGKELQGWTKAATGLNTEVDAEGGFLVPPQFMNQVLDRTYSNDLLSRITLLPVTGNTLRIPAIHETSRAEGSRYGGVQGRWRAEAGQMTGTKPKFREIGLTLESLYVFVPVTDELLADSAVALEAYVSKVASEELAFKIGAAIFEGDGAGKPLGLMNSPCKITVAKEAGQAANTIKAENILNMWSRRYGIGSNYVWLINQDVEPQLSLMTIGTAGAQLAAYLPPGGLSQSAYGTLMGRPVIPTEFNSTLGTEGDIVLVDLSQYIGISKGNVETAVSAHLRFDYGEQIFRFTFRFDGEPWWNAPLTPYKGSSTQSPVITLATRA